MSQALLNIQEKRKKNKTKIVLYLTHVSEEDEDMVMMSMKPYTEIVKYNSTWSGFLALGWGLKNLYFTVHLLGGGWYIITY